MRNSRVVPYRKGRPTTFFFPAIRMSPLSSRVFSDPCGSTPRISWISGAVIGCL
jgi:hypothetical protein